MDLSLLPACVNCEVVVALCRNGLISLVEQGALRAIDCSGVKQLDGAGVALLWVLERRAEQVGTAGLLVGLAEEFRRQLAAFEEAQTRAATAPEAQARPAEGAIEALGHGVCTAFARLGEALGYLGELIVSLRFLFRGRFRWRDFAQAFQRSGVEAVPVVVLIGFLLGLILAFQSAIPLKMFGGEGFVGGLVGLALVRELGLIITAILMAGRTGSSFAAELGTMKVNEEIDALETMGLKPVVFLALPRVLAGTFALPILSLFASLAGLVGGWLVMLVLGFPLSYYLDQLQTFVALSDLVGSTVKAFLFGFMVSAVGCWQGLKTGRDAGAVGTATTAAVVTGIVLLTILEGLLSVVFYAMGW